MSTLAPAPAILQYIYVLTPGVYLIRSLVPEAPLSVIVTDPALRQTAGFHGLTFRVMGGGNHGDPQAWTVEPIPEKNAGDVQLYFQGQNVRPPYFFVPQVVPAINIATSHPCVAIPLFLPAPGVGISNAWIRGTEGAQPMPLIPNENEMEHPPATRGVGPTLRALFGLLNFGGTAAQTEPPQLEADKPPAGRRR